MNNDIKKFIKEDPRGKEIALWLSGVVRKLDKASDIDPKLPNEIYAREARARSLASEILAKELTDVLLYADVDESDKELTEEEKVYYGK